MSNITVQNILVPVDLSAYSGKVMQIAGAVSAMNKACLTLLYVVDVSRYLLPENRLTPGLVPELVSIFQGSLRKQAQRVSETFDVPVYTHVVCGYPVEEILKFITFNPVDMVVSGIADDPVHSTAASASTIFQLASRASCPVWGLVDGRHDPRLSGRAKLIRAKIRLLEKVKKIRIRRIRPPSNLVTDMMSR